ncbi:hypothetical protein BJ508DRAFT_358084 [Ascobolus immersus RN42]|uniref:DUF7918 domain-containing protein n=1 Tax=Ascobolus immersus RN42 TaxID=1160509 RepID=A0A3N4IQH2_ASCIM|nr:hypothetical protein BJ508DRAFT_358084 [Ascobolus immersus RN42]
MEVKPTSPLQFSDNFLGYGMQLTVDGVVDAFVDTMCHRLGRGVNGHTWHGLRINMPDRTGAIPKQMLFSPLRKLMEEGHEDVEGENIGKIIVKFYQIKSWETIPHQLRPVQASMVEGPVLESVLKGSSASHHTCVGNSLQYVPAFPAETIHWTTPVEKPILTLRIFYRSRGKGFAKLRCYTIRSSAS